MHVFPQLRKLEHKYPRELAVIGVHSAKFTAEKETDNIRQAVLRYGIEHPVVNDRDFHLWQQYAVRAWPTLIFVDPLGKVIGKNEGELHFESFDGILQEMIQEFSQKGWLDRKALGFQGEKIERGNLMFPGKVLAHGASNRLFIADSNGNRIVVASLDGHVQEVIGSGEEKLADGGFSEASFNHPQGMALAGELLYVADTENHAIRKVDLGSRRVETVAGLGEQATSFHAGGKATGVSLNSPWDLALHNGTLYVAMAGFHQIWALELSRGEIRPYAGSGREDLADGTLAYANLAQPSGISTDGQRLYFADSETSSLRTADLGSGGEVRTIVGKGLFEFGDVDGTGDGVKLQHPLGVCYHDGVLYVADSYNHKIKRAYPLTREVTTFLGDGQPGLRDGPGSQARFHEPGGLSVAKGVLYVTDTNNHSIRVADLKTGKVETLELKGIS